MDKKLIAIAEDEVAYANLLKSQLEKEGYTVLLAFNGNDFLKMIHEQKPQLILLDLLMPIKNGFDTLSEIRKDDDLKDITVIALSNLGESEEIEKAKTLGANEFIVKSDENFYSVIKKIKTMMD